jgi:hypothetical protein
LGPFFALKYLYTSESFALDGIKQYWAWVAAKGHRRA